MKLIVIGLFWLSAGLDFVLADPWGWPHPVQAIGWAIAQGKNWILKTTDSSPFQKNMGIALGIGVIFGSALLAGGLVAIGHPIHRGLGLGIAVVLLASCFAGRGLRRAAEDVLGSGTGGVLLRQTQVVSPLSEDNLTRARDRLRLYVGRDTEHLNEAEIYRALFETVTENAVDGVLAPLFYAGVGAIAASLLAPADANLSQWVTSLAVATVMGYKASSTLDSMVGYREAPYTHLGWFSAKFEDALTWFPCRTAVLCIALLSGRPRRVLQRCWQDARTDPSPNAGWSECVYAAALGVQVGGDNYYRGQLQTKPRLGADEQPITLERIIRAFVLTRRCFLLWLLLISLVLWATL